MMRAAYLTISVAGIVPFYAFRGIPGSPSRQCNRIAPIVWVIVLSNLLNAGLNWVFVYGNLGSPPLLCRGSAIATVVARWASAIALFVLARRELAPRFFPHPGRRNRSDGALVDDQARRADRSANNHWRHSPSGRLDC